MPFGSSNFQIFNPGSANQETDVQYTADTLRIGGATTGALLPSKTDNKFRYQMSVAVYGLMQMMANKGFVVSDVSAATLASVMSNIVTTADIKTGLLNVAWSPSLVFDCAKANGFQCILTGNVTALSLINLTAGQTVTMAFTQGGSGGYSVTFPSNVKGPGVIVGAVGWTSQQNWFTTNDLNLRPIGLMTASN